MKFFKQIIVIVLLTSTFIMHSMDDQVPESTVIMHDIESQVPELTVIEDTMEDQGSPPIIIFANQQKLTLSFTEWETLLNNSSYIQDLIKAEHSGIIPPLSPYTFNKEKFTPINLKEFNKDTFKLLLDAISSNQLRELLKPYNLKKLVQLIPIIDYLDLKVLHAPLAQLITEQLTKTNMKNLDTTIKMLQLFTRSPIIDLVSRKLAYYIKGVMAQVQVNDMSESYIHSEDKITHAYFSPNNKLILVTFNNESNLNFFSVENKNPFGTIYLKAIPKSISWDPTTTKRIAIAFSDAIPIIQDLSKKDDIQLPHTPPTWSYQHPIDEIYFSSDGSKIVTYKKNSDEHTTVFLWDAKTNKLLETFLNNKRIKTTTLSPDNSTIAIASENPSGNIAVWTLHPFSYFRVLAEPMEVQSLEFSRDGKRLLVNSGLKCKIWDINTKKVVATLKGECKIARFSPDGSKIITVSKNKATVWDGTLYTKLYTLSHDTPVQYTKLYTLSRDTLPHANEINNASFSPDNLQILTASDDMTFKAWDSNSGKLLYNVVFSDEVLDAFFSPNGSTILARTKNNVYYWILPTYYAHLFSMLSFNEKIRIIALYNHNPEKARQLLDAKMITYTETPILERP